MSSFRITHAGAPLVKVRQVRPNPSILEEGFSNSSILEEGFSNPSISEEETLRKIKVYLVPFYPTNLLIYASIGPRCRVAVFLHLEMSKPVNLKPKRSPCHGGAEDETKNENRIWLHKA